MVDENSQARVLVFAPTRNDWSELERLTEEVTALGREYRMLIIDDGSDTAPDFALESLDGLRVALPSNYGLGTCTHVALDHADRANYQAVVRIDSDGQHPVREIPRLVQPILSGRADLAIGCRTNHLAGSGLRVLLARAAKGYFVLLGRWLTGGRCPSDINTGFLAFGPEAIRALREVDLDRYPEPQIIILAYRLNLSVETIEIEQEARRHGRSTIDLLRGVQITYHFTIFVLGELLQRRRRVVE